MTTQDAQYGADLKTASFNQNTAADFAVVSAPGAGKRIVITGIRLIANGAVDVTFQSANNNLSGPMTLAAASLIEASGTRESPLFTCNVNEDFSIVLSAAIKVAGWISYYVEVV